MSYDGSNDNDKRSGDDGARHRGYSGERGPGAGLGDLFDRLISDVNPVREQIDKNAKALAQSALARLDVVPRAEFDAQTAVLKRTRERVEALEQELEQLSALVNQQEAGNR